MKKMLIGFFGLIILLLSFPLSRVVPEGIWVSMTVSGIILMLTTSLTPNKEKEWKLKSEQKTFLRGFFSGTLVLAALVGLTYATQELWHIPYLPVVLVMAGAVLFGFSFVVIFDVDSGPSLFDAFIHPSNKHYFTYGTFKRSMAFGYIIWPILLLLLLFIPSTRDAIKNLF
jgi:archaellum biogenesis protein FlaJ (TadC family)